MGYSVVIHKEDDSCLGINMPNIKSYFSAADKLNEAIENTKEVISGYLEGLADVSAFLEQKENAAVILSKLLMNKIDFVVTSGYVKIRSNFLAESAMKALGSQSNYVTK